MNELNNPKIGEIVLYWVNDSDSPELRYNYASVLPAMIVQVWTDVTVNLKVFTDGPIDTWKTSVIFGTDKGQWSRLQ
mgnify:CR=1 FL=1